MATPYKDLGKKAKDLISKLYPDPKKTGDNLAVAVSSTLKAAKNVKVVTEANKHANGQDVSGTVETTFDFKEEHNVTLKVKLDTAQKYNVSAEVENLGVDGSKVEAGVAFEEAKTTGLLNLGFKNENVNVGIDTTYEFGVGLPKLNVNLAGGNGNISGGVNVELDLNDDLAQSPAGLALVYTDDKNVGTFYGRRNDKGALTGGLSFFHNLNAETDLGLDVNITKGKDKDLDLEKAIVSIGAQYQPRKTSLVKGKLQNTGFANEVRFAFAAEETFENFKLQTAYDLNLLAFCAGKSEDAPAGVGHQFAVKLIFE